MNQSTGPIQIELTRDETLVLFEFLSRYADTEQLTIEDQSEEVVLSGMIAELEKHLAEPFREDYADLLRAARDRLREIPPPGEARG